MDAHEQIIMTVAAILWSIALALMIVATVIPPEMLIVAGWGLLAGVVAAVLTVWALVRAQLRRERLRVETICRLVLNEPDRPGMRSV